MRKLLLILGLALCAWPCFGQQVLPINSGVVIANMQNGTTFFKVSLTANVTSLSIIGQQANVTSATIIFQQDNTGGRTVTFASNITGCTVTGTANASTVCVFTYDPGTASWFGTGGGSVSLPTIQYVSNNGTDTSDGLSWGTAKLTIAAACAAIPSGNSSCSAGSGVVYVAPGFSGTYPSSIVNTISIVNRTSLSSTDNHNLSVGNGSLGPASTGTNNVAVGYNTLASNTSGSNNTVVGYFSLNSNATGSGNTVVGSDAAQFLTADNEVAIGFTALLNATTGTDNVAVGWGALHGQTTGFQSIGIGSSALSSAQLAANDIAIGHEAAQYAVEANNNDSNTVIGEHSLYQSTNDSYNTCIGRASCYRLTTGTGNINIGGLFATMLVPPDGWTLALQAGSGLSVGTYAYKIAWTLNGANTELSENLTNTITTTTGNQQVVISSLPAYTGPLTCTQTLIYRTKVGFVLGNQRWFLDGTIGNCAGGSFTDAVADASLGAEDASPSNTIVVGYAPTDPGDQTAYKSNQAVFGSPSNPYTEFWLGGGVYANTPHDTLISATGGNGTNVAGANLIFSGGPSTGSAGSGAIIFDAAAGASSGAIWNPVAEVGRFDSQGIHAAAYNTKTNCSSSASPAVCASAPAGSVKIAAGSTSVTVNTTAVTANSQIFVIEDDSLGTKLSVTCNTSILASQPEVTARVAGTSFTITASAAPVTNPACYSYLIVN